MSPRGHRNASVSPNPTDVTLPSQDTQQGWDGLRVTFHLSQRDHLEAMDGEADLGHLQLEGALVVPMGA